jgi:monoamine oxidase
VKTSALPIYFEDLVLDSPWHSSGRTITETDVVVHAGHTGDFFPHHMDAEFAKNTPFGQRIAHGTMTFAIAIGMKAAKINPAQFTYGFDRIRFPKPVFIGDTIIVHATVVSKELDAKRPAYGRYVEHVEVITQHDQVVMVVDHVGLIERRPAVA